MTGHAVGGSERGRGTEWGGGRRVERGHQPSPPCYPRRFLRAPRAQSACRVDCVLVMSRGFLRWLRRAHSPSTCLMPALVRGRGCASGAPIARVVAGRQATKRAWWVPAPVPVPVPVHRYILVIAHTHTQLRHTRDVLARDHQTLPGGAPTQATRNSSIPAACAPHRDDCLERSHVALRKACTHHVQQS